MTRTEIQVRLDKFQPKAYQRDLWTNFLNGKYKKFLAIWARRSGKTLTMFNLLIHAALKRPGNYVWCEPFYSQCRRVVWNALVGDKDSAETSRFLDYLPKDLVSNINNTEMRIQLINGSQISFCGSDNFNHLMGMNIHGLVMDEMALSRYEAYEHLIPCLRSTDGFVLIGSTPRGRGPLFDLYNIATSSPDWYVSFLTLNETQHIPLAAIERDKEMSADKKMQEYYCDWNLGQEGTLLGKQLVIMRQNGQVGNVCWESHLLTGVATDWGLDKTVLIFYQIVGENVHIISFYENSNLPLDHYIKVIKEKPYTYGANLMIAPHDFFNRQQNLTISTRYEASANMGIRFRMAPNLTIQDGLCATQAMCSKLWIDQGKCSALLRHMELYRQEYNEKLKSYTGKPLHDDHSHACFVDDTMVITKNGARPIISIQDNDEVLTLSGFKKCTAAQKTKSNAEIVKITFDDSTEVKCTYDHRFLTVDGWVEAINLEKGAEIKSSLSLATNTIKSVEHLKEYSDVYCIAVPGYGHFSLANGSIVSNCDALRMLAVTLPLLHEGLTPEKLDAIYAEAMGQKQLPRFFQEDECSEPYNRW